METIGIGTEQGVLGLTPFLKKACPQLLKELPNRLRGFQGKTIVIDGTLITHRLHFAALPHDYRHVLGWYRLIKELRECDVRAICVFDGERRVSAKSNEAARRSRIRSLTLARAAIEAERHLRLQSVAQLLQRVKELPSSERKQTLERIPAVSSTLVDARGVPLILEEPFEQDEPEAPPETAGQLSPVPPELIDALASLTTQQTPVVKKGNVPDASPPFPSREPQPSPSVPRPPPSAPSTPKTPLSTTIKSGIRSQPSVAPSQPALQPPEISSRLAALFDAHKRDYQKVTTLEAESVLADDSGDSTPTIAQSKTQLELQSAEQSVWVSLGDDLDATTKAITELAEKSRDMSESLKRRSSLPTSKTFAECKEILRALGVQCITVEEQYEAEAVAAALVLGGQADYVASEDTDVLVYNAPLIRNIANRQGPLVLMSGPDIRTQLDLTNDRFIDFALLLGTDFSDRIKNVGPARAFKFIREHGTIEEVLKHEVKYPPRVAEESYLEQIEVARNVFRAVPPAPDLGSLERVEEDEEEVRDVMRKYKLGKEIEKDQDHLSSASTGDLERPMHVHENWQFLDDDPGLHAPVAEDAEDYQPQWRDFKIGDDIRASPYDQT